MAICTFRADNFDFAGLLAGGDLQTVLAWLERVRNGLLLSEVEKEGGTGLVESLVRSGLASLRDGKVFLDPRGEKILQACRDGKVPGVPGGKRP